MTQHLPLLETAESMCRDLFNHVAAEHRQEFVTKVRLAAMRSSLTDQSETIDVARLVESVYRGSVLSYRGYRGARKFVSHFPTRSH